MEETRKTSRKGWKIAVVALLLLIAVGVTAVVGLWHNELATLLSFEMLQPADPDHRDGAVYQMEVQGNYYFPEFLEQGGASNDRELIGFVTQSITKGLIPMKIETTTIGCAAFTAQTAEGNALFGRNYDFDPTNTCIVTTHPTDGRHASVSTVDLQFLGIDEERGVEGMMDRINCLAAPYAPLDGVNDAGVACAILMTMQGPDGGVVATDQQTEKPDITSTTLLRLILDYADSVEEAVELAAAYDLHDSTHTSFHYMVADSTGRSAILEWTAGTDGTDTDGAARTLHVYYNDEDAELGTWEAESDFQWLTNFVVVPDYYEDPAARTGFDRYQSLYEDLSGCGGVVADTDQAMGFLQTIGRRVWPNSTGVTVHSAVFDLKNCTMHWVANEHYDDPAYCYTFSAVQ